MEYRREAAVGPGARSAKGASTTGRTQTHSASSNPSNPLGRAIGFQTLKLLYAWSVASQPAPATHDDLVRALANLGEGERREVIAAAERAARQRKPHVVASWRSIRSAIGVVRGETADAVADTAELYDG
jgi:hypothetical protein